MERFNLRELAKQRLLSGLRTGKFALDDGEILELKASEIIAIAKYVLTGGLEEDVRMSSQSEFPSEMFIPPVALKYHSNEYEEGVESDEGDL